MEEGTEKGEQYYMMMTRTQSFFKNEQRCCKRCEVVSIKNYTVQVPVLLCESPDMSPVDNGTATSVSVEMLFLCSDR